MTKVFCIAHVAFTLAGDDPPAWTFAKATLGLVVLAHTAGLLNIVWRIAPDRQPRPSVIFVGGLGLVALGTAAGLSAYFLGVMRGDFEFYNFVGGAVLIALGGVSAWVTSPRLPVRSTPLVPSLRK